jgi:hypothetical protein
MLPAWNPTSKEIPSPTHRGEPDTLQIDAAVGRALSEYEHLQSALGILFQLLCEAPSFAASRAFGTVDSASGHVAMLRAAEEVFFGTREPLDAKDAEYHAEMKALFSASEKAQEFRNNIAHGMASQCRIGDNAQGFGFLSGYFLCPPPYSMKKVAMVAPKEQYLLEAKYFYSVADINHYRDRFTQLVHEAYRLASEINGKYKILEIKQIIPG